MTIRRSRSAHSRRRSRGLGRAARSQTTSGRLRQLGTRRLESQWAAMISDQEWAIYHTAIHALEAARIPFLLGGGFALAAYTGRWRDTKDIDFYIRPADRPRAVAAMSSAGFADYHSRLPYDRNWIYRSVWSNVIVDLIWAMANQRAQVDRLWFQRAGTIVIRNQKLKVVPPEELLWCKLYILQRDHCDWTDAFNLLYSIKGALDWAYLLRRLEDDRMLLEALLTVYSWACPEAAGQIPQTLLRQLRGSVSSHGIEPRHNRLRLLDSRNWFAALLPPGGKLEV